MKTNHPGFMATLVRSAACAFVLAAVVWGMAYVFLPERARDTISFLEGRILLFGGLSSVAVAAALTFWVTKKIRGRFAKRGFEDFGLAQRWTRFLREHHGLFGWLAFATATAHAVYFAVDSPALTAHAITGWVGVGSDGDARRSRSFAKPCIIFEGREGERPGSVWGTRDARGVVRRRALVAFLVPCRGVRVMDDDGGFRRARVVEKEITTQYGIRVNSSIRDEIVRRSDSHTGTDAKQPTAFRIT